MARAIALGDKHLVMGFTAAGIEVVPVADEHEFARQLGLVARDSSVAVVLATEQMAALAPEALAHFREASAAALLIVPGYEGATRAGFAEVRKIVERSLGVDLLGKE